MEAICNLRFVYAAVESDEKQQLEQKSEENLRSNSDGGRHLLSNYWSFLHDWKSDCWMGNLNKMSLNVVQNTWKSQG